MTNWAGVKCRLLIGHYILSGFGRIKKYGNRKSVKVEDTFFFWKKGTDVGVQSVKC